MSRGPDLRFAIIEDAADLLRMLPDPERVAWPCDEGDMAAIDDALAWLAAWVPKARAAHKEHRRVVKAHAALRMAMANGRRG